MVFTVPTGTAPQSITVDPSGKYAYVTNGLSNNLSAFTIDPSTGLLAPAAPAFFAGQPGPVSMAMTHGSQALKAVPKFAYATNLFSNDLNVYAISAATGSLTGVGSTPAGTAPISLAVDPTGRFAYVVDDVTGSNNVQSYTINPATGALTGVLALPISAGATPHAVTVDPSGRFAYVASTGVYAYTIDADTGALTDVPGAPYLVGSSAQSVAVDPSGRFAYAAANDSVYAFSIDSATGALAAVGSPAAAGNSPISVAVEPSGRFVYVANYDFPDSHIFIYAIDGTTGALSLVNGYWEGTSPSSVAVEPSGRFLYAAEQGSNEVVASLISSTTGTLLKINSIVEAGTAPSSVAIDPSGKYVYAANAGASANSISQYTIGSDGSLTAMATAAVPAGTQPSSITTLGIWQ